MLLREKALQVALTQVGVTEVGGNNRGPKVSEFQKADDLPGEGYAWCMSFVQWCYLKAGKALPNRTASVGFFADWARKAGHLVTRPLRGDVVCFQFNADNWPDHVGIVERVVRLGPVMVVKTVEGNTSSGDAGSQDDGGGVHKRTRTIRSGRALFARVPGDVPTPPPPPKPKVRVFDLHVDGRVLLKDQRKIAPVLTRANSRILDPTVKEVRIRKRFITPAV